jgi:hypothetical protein
VHERWAGSGKSRKNREFLLIEIQSLFSYENRSAIFRSQIATRITIKNPIRIDCDPIFVQKPISGFEIEIDSRFSFQNRSAIENPKKKGDIKDGE